MTTTETDLARLGGFRTLDARPTEHSLVKPGELVDLVEMTPLTLADRRIYNLLIENAWDAIDKPVTHTIAKERLRGNHNSNDRIGASIERLMASIVRVKVTWEGETAIERIQLLGSNIEYERSDGLLHYEIPPRLRRIIKNSRIFARLQKEVMFALSSKYALTLYEMLQKRRNLTWRDHEDFSIDEIRDLLGVPRGKLTNWTNLNNRAIVRAAEEVNRLSDMVVAFEPLKTGRRVTGVRMRWWAKDAGMIEAPGETGGGRTDTALGYRLSAETYETARLRHPGHDIYHIEALWIRWSRSQGAPPRHPDQAFLAFCRAHVARNAL